MRGNCERYVASASSPNKAGDSRLGLFALEYRQNLTSSGAVLFICHQIDTGCHAVRMLGRGSAAWERLHFGCAGQHATLALPFSEDRVGRSGVRKNTSPLRTAAGFSLSDIPRIPGPSRVIFPPPRRGVQQTSIAAVRFCGQIIGSEGFAGLELIGFPSSRGTSRIVVRGIRPQSPVMLARAAPEAGR
jgi:hypothetical protein